MLKTDDVLQSLAIYLELEKIIQTKFSISTIYHSKLFSKFILSPIEYLAEKIECKSASIKHIQKEITVNKKSLRVLNTSLSAQLRNIYEAWVFLGLLYSLADEMIYPNNLLQSLELHRSNSADPTVVINLNNNKRLALFLDTPLPYNNSPNKQQPRSRPDIGIYLLRQPKANFSLFKNLKLIALIECKESIIWPWTKKIIYNPFNQMEKVEVTHLQMLLTYEKLYTPPLLFLISRMKTPAKALTILNSTKIHVLDSVGFNFNSLLEISEKINLP